MSTVIVMGGGKWRAVRMSLSVFQGSCCMYVVLVYHSVNATQRELCSSFHDVSHHYRWKRAANCRSKRRWRWGQGVNVRKQDVGPSGGPTRGIPLVGECGGSQHGPEWVSSGEAHRRLKCMHHTPVHWGMFSPGDQDAPDPYQYSREASLLLHWDSCLMCV